MKPVRRQFACAVFLSVNMEQGAAWPSSPFVSRSYTSTAGSLRVLIMRQKRLFMASPFFLLLPCHTLLFLSSGSNGSAKRRAAAIYQLLSVPSSLTLVLQEEIFAVSPKSFFWATCRVFQPALWQSTFHDGKAGAEHSHSISLMRLSIHLSKLVYWYPQNAHCLNENIFPPDLVHNDRRGFIKGRVHQFPDIKIWRSRSIFGYVAWLEVHFAC